MKLILRRKLYAASIMIRDIEVLNDIKITYYLNVRITVQYVVESQWKVC